MSRGTNGIITHLCQHRHSLVGKFKKKIHLVDQGVMAPPVMIFFQRHVNLLLYLIPF